MTYTLLVQHTTTKKTYSWILEDLTPTSLYYKFNVELYSGMQDGEYEFILFENKNGAEIEININDIFSSTLVNEDTVIATNGLITIGNSSSKIVYDKEQSYISYER